MRNRYCYHSRLSEYKFRLLLRCFCDDLDTNTAAKNVGISRVRITSYFALIRKRIMTLTNKEEALSGEIEIDESYFGARRVRGKRGRGASGKIPVIGLLKRNGKVYVQPVKNCTRRELMPIIKGKIISQSTIYTDGWTSYDGLVLNGYKHYRIHHHENEFARGKNHINGIESFWSYAKRRMVRQNGVRKDKFMLHLKESEYRWNHRKENMYQSLLEDIKKNPLSFLS